MICTREGTGDISGTHGDGLTPLDVHPCARLDTSMQGEMDHAFNLPVLPAPASLHYIYVLALGKTEGIVIFLPSLLLVDWLIFVQCYD